MADETKVGGGGRGERSTSSDRSMTWLWMTLSLVVVVGFLAWLGLTSEPTTVLVSEDDVEAVGGADEDLGEGVISVPKDTLAADKAAYEGQRVRVAEVEATAELGPAIFWGELGDRANQVPILVRLDSAAARDWEMRQGALYTVTGEVRRMSDSVATAWGEQGEFAGEGEEMQATFTDYFIQASRIRASRASDSRAGTGGSAGEGRSGG